jgi:hypothetical protein
MVVFGETEFRNCRVDGGIGLGALTVIGTNDIEARSAFYFMTSPLERHEAPEISVDAPDS